MALPLAMTMRSTTSGGKPFATIQILPRAHVNRSSRAASASTRSTTSVPRRRVFHTIGVPPSVGRMLLATIQEGRHDAAVRQGRRRSRGSDGGLTGHGCARSAEIVGRIVLRGHPLHAAKACVKLLNHMVQYMTTRLDTSFAALSDATRRGVLEQLGRSDASITDLAEKFHMTLTGMKKHVGVLEQAGLVTTKKIRRVRKCQPGPPRLEVETAWLDRYRQRWDERFDELDKVVEELTRKEKSDERKNRK